MESSYLFNPKSIKFHLRKYIDNNQELFRDKVIVDIPAGNGLISNYLHKLDADVLSFDLFPEYYRYDQPVCNKCDITKGIPIRDNSVDLIIYSEGIEHFTDHNFVFKEFSRILKPEGQLILTTPSYSCLASKISYLLFESENIKNMPPNEFDDIWMNFDENNIYFGHIALTGLQKLRLYGKINSLKMEKIRFVRTSKASIPLLLIFYPFIFIISLINYRKNLQRHKNVDFQIIKSIYKEQLKININIRNLINRHIFIVYKKTDKNLINILQTFKQKVDFNSNT